MRGGEAVLLHQTEYARDGIFAYRSARLVEWAQERSGGLFDAERGEEVPIEQLREGGADSVTEALRCAWRTGAPTVCAPDAETIEDLEVIAGGLRRAVAGGVSVITRCAPTFAGVLGRNLATDFVSPPTVPGGVLIVCGS